MGPLDTYGLLDLSPNIVILNVTNKHQLSQALLATQDNYFSEKVVAENANIFLENNYPAYVAEVVRKVFPFSEKLYISDSVVFRGMSYSKNMYLCIKSNYNDNLYIISKIDYILVDSAFNTISFLGPCFETKYDSSSGLYHRFPITIEDIQE